MLNAVLDIPHFSAEDKASLVCAQINARALLPVCERRTYRRLQDPRLIRSDHPAVLRGMLTLLSRAAVVLSKAKEAPAFHSALKAIEYGHPPSM